MYKYTVYTLKTEWSAEKAWKSLCYSSLTLTPTTPAEDWIDCKVMLMTRRTHGLWAAVCFASHFEYLTSVLTAVYGKCTKKKKPFIRFDIQEAKPITLKAGRLRSLEKEFMKNHLQTQFQKEEWAILMDLVWSWENLRPPQIFSPNSIFCVS